MKIQGTIDFFKNNILSGWVQSDDNPITLKAIIDEKFIFQTQAELNRPDLKGDLSSAKGFIIDLSSHNSSISLKNIKIIAENKHGEQYNLPFWKPVQLALEVKELPKNSLSVFFNTLKMDSDFFISFFSKRSINNKLEISDKNKIRKYLLYGLTIPLDTYYEKSTEELFEKTGANTGNLAFHYALKIQINNLHKSIDWGYSIPKEFDNGYSTAIIPCANQLGEHTNLENLANIIKKQNCYFVAIGLGAQSDSFDTIPDIAKGTLNWVRSIIEHTQKGVANISLRGRYSQKVLEKYNLADNTVITGCPSLFLNSNKNLGKSIEKNICNPKRVAVVGGHPKWLSLNKIETSLIKIVTETKGAYIAQSPLEMIKITRGELNKIKQSLIQEYKNYLAPEMAYSDFFDWMKFHGNTFFDTVAWIEYYKHFDFVIGARLHGIMLALQASVPALCIVHDSRTLEMCQTMKIPYVLAKDIEYGIKREDLLRLFKFDSYDFDKNRIILCKRYIDFLNSNKIECSSFLLNIVQKNSINTND